VNNQTVRNASALSIPAGCPLFWKRQHRRCRELSLLSVKYRGRIVRTVVLDRNRCFAAMRINDTASGLNNCDSSSGFSSLTENSGGCCRCCLSR
jgi:hypothetical protein